MSIHAQPSGRTPAAADEPLVSIVIPAYNNADYLDETMKTVLGQTYTNLEVIVSDHASTDATWTVMQRYRSDPGSPCCTPRPVAARCATGTG
jgi:glycosyltransferase involved in cell wall biosynthesis